jgi:hypothetical protein
MEQAKQGRRTLSVRLAENGYLNISQRAEREDVDVSHMVRRMLAYATANMPEGWVPPKRKP